MLTLLSALGGAESYAQTVTQNLNTMYGNGTLTISDDLKTGTTEFVTYTCSGAAEFGYETFNPAGSRRIAIIINKDGVVTTTAIQNLRDIYIIHYPADKTCTNIDVYLSNDNSTWTKLNPETDDIYYRNGVIKAYFPKGDYYLKFVNTTKTTVAMLQIQYTIQNCNCFKYKEEI